MTELFDITDGVVHELGGGFAAGFALTADTTDGLRWDCSIGGMPFFFFVNDQYPLRRETAGFRRDRIDTERNPGEQSLDSGYWLRSQSSWHYGSGLASAEPLEVNSDEAQFRYVRGGGVDPWTPGQMSLLNDTSSMLSSAGADQLLLGVDTGVLHADGTVVKYIANGGSVSTVTWGGATNPVTSITSDGANYYAANSTGIYKGALPSSAGSKVWDTGATTVCRWVKSRLMAAIGTSLYELTTGGPTLPTALFTHSNTAWVWTDIAEGPAAIYVSGYSGDQSAIYRIAVDSTTTTVTLDQPTIVSELPRGEIVYSLYSYVGSYLVVGTNKGARVALINGDGSLSLGPLVVQSTDGCKDAVAVGSFVYVTVGSKGEAGNRVQRAGLYRMDLGTTLDRDSLRFAAAADLVVPSGISGAAHQVTTAGGRVWFTVSGQGVYRQNTTYVADGWVETGRIRMGTVESKVWRSLRLLQEQGTTGSLWGYATITANASAPSTWTKILELASGTYDNSGSLATVAPTPGANMHVAIKLVRGASASTTPILIGYQVKAMPSPTRSELISIPVLCYDRESDRNNTWTGRPGYAWQRFNTLKQMERTASTVRWEDYTTGETAEAFIEQVSLTRTTPPTRNQSGAGGIITIVLRLV